MPTVSLSQLLWNYGVAVVLVAGTYGVTLWIKERPFPELPRTKRAIVYLATGFALVVSLASMVWLLVSRTNVSIIFLGIDRYLHLHGWPPAVRLRMEELLFGLPMTLLIVGFSLWRLGSWRKSSFSVTWRDIASVVAMIGLTSGLSLLQVRLFRVPNLAVWPPLSIYSLALLVIQFFINGLQEETFFRGYAFPQTLQFLRSPLITLWFVTTLFNASHIPSFILGPAHQSMAWWQWLLICIFPLQPTGWVFGFMYYRFRRILPGAIFHTYTTFWAFPFFY